MKIEEVSIHGQWSHIKKDCEFTEPGSCKSGMVCCHSQFVNLDFEIECHCDICPKIDRIPNVESGSITECVSIGRN